MKIGSDRFWKTIGAIIGIAALLALLMAANYVAGRTRLRHDFTQDKLYSLSNGSRAILKKLDQKVTLKLFFNSSSPEVPQNIKDYARQVEDLLSEYALASDGRIVVEKYDPQPDSDAEEWAQHYGIQGSPIQMFGPPLYFGLVCSCGSTDGALPTLDPRSEQMLEYNVTRLIYRVTHPEKPVIGVLSCLPVMIGNVSMAMRQQPQPWLAFRELRDDYAVKSISTTAEEIGPEVKALIIVHPKNLSDKTLYAIDQFVLRGGKVLAFLDPFSVAEADSGPQSQFSMAKNSSNMNKLLSTWGVSYDDDKVLADPSASTTIGTSASDSEESLVVLSLGTNNLSRTDIITAQLEHLQLPFAGTFSCAGGGGLTVTPLIFSSAKAGTLDSMSARYGGSAVLNRFTSSGMKMDVAIRLTGAFKTAFPEGKPKDANSTNDMARAEAGPGLTNGVSTIILVGDTDMIYDRFCVEEMNFLGSSGYRPRNDNLNFFMNAVEQIAGSQDLVGIRCRSKFNRSFDRVVALQQKAVQQWQEKEGELERELKETQQQLGQMEANKDKSQRFVLSEEQKTAIAKFKARETGIKKELKSVRKSLRGDIENLGVKVKLLNIALMPLFVIVAGIAFWVYRRNRK